MTKTDDKKPANEITQKDRTIFCINIDERCTEDILYELFLQVGPIESIVRKSDRNGHLIALVTYKHYESVDYAVRLFDKIILFGQRLKVQLSQQPPQANKDNLNRTNSINDLNKSNSSNQQQSLQRTPSYNRVPSLDSLMNLQQQQQQPLIPLPLQQQQIQMFQTLMQQAACVQPGLMNQFFTPPQSLPLTQQSPQQQPHVSRFDDRNNNNQKRNRPHKSDQSHHQHHHSHHQHHQNHHHNQHSSYERNNPNNNSNYSNRDRSRSPHQRQRR